jgi:hypothetical protein
MSTRETDNPDVRHETSDVNIRAILGFGLGLIVVAVVIHVAIWLLFMFFEGREAHGAAREFPMAIGRENRVPPEPRLQPSPPEWKTPREELEGLRARENAILESYGLDKATGDVRIPISEAMKLTVQRGLPARAAGQGKR